MNGLISGAERGWIRKSDNRWFWAGIPGVRTAIGMILILLDLLVRSFMRESVIGGLGQGHRDLTGFNPWSSRPWGLSNTISPFRPSHIALKVHRQDVVRDVI